MKLKVSSKDIERYFIEKEKIVKIVSNLANSNSKDARDNVVEFIAKTNFRTKFDEPEKDITKYIAIEILKNETITLKTYLEFIDSLWEIENSSVREISSFIMGQIYDRDPEAHFEIIVKNAKLCLNWNDIDNWAGYSLEEYAAKDYNKYLEKLSPLIIHENQWVRRLAIVVLGRGFFLTKDERDVVKCFKAIEPSFSDSRKIVLDANSWIVGTLGFRVNPEEVVRYFEKYSNSKDYTIIKLFCDIVKRSKLVRDLPDKLLRSILEILQIWLKSEETKTRKTVESAIKFIG